MALSFPLSVPDYNDIQQMQIETFNAVSRSASPYTLSHQTQENSGVVRIFRFQLRPMFKEDANTWIAWLESLRGGSKTLLIGDPHNRSPQGSASTSPGTPLVAGASQTGAELDIDGCPANATGYLLAGDWIQLGSGVDARLYRVTATVSTNGSGAATVDIFPDLRTSPADNSAVTVSSTEGCFRLVEPRVAVSVGVHHVHDIEFQVIESL